MTSSVKTKPNRWDLLVVAAVAALAVVCGIVFWARSAPSGGKLTAVVSVNGKETDQVVLSSLSEAEDRTYHNNGYTLTVEFTPESVRVTTSDCPNQVCVHTGAITRAGQSIVCLPSRISIQLQQQGGGTHDGVDAVIG